MQNNIFQQDESSVSLQSHDESVNILASDSIRRVGGAVALNVQSASGKIGCLNPSRDRT